MHKFVVSSILLATLILAGPANALHYRVTDLGTLGGSLCLPEHNFGSTVAFGYAINDAGQAAGGACVFTSSFDHVIRAFRWENGAMRNLGTLGERQSVANGINANGQVVGRSYDSLAGGTAFWTDPDGNLRSLAPVLGGFSAAFDINDSGRVVGLRGSPPNIAVWSAFAYDTVTGDVIDLPGLGGTFRSEARAINNTGTIVGAASTPSNAERHAVVWNGSAALDLGTLGGGDSVATAVNATGAVAGLSTTGRPSETHAFLWTAATGMRDLGALGRVTSLAFGIDDAGHVVGATQTESSFTPHAFIYWDGMHDLNDFISAGSGWLLVEARAINASGQIVGFGIRDGHERAFLLTPEDTTPPSDTTAPTLDVPEDIITGLSSPEGAVVTFTVTATDPDDEASTPTCSPASGSVFPVGTTLVMCSSIDTNGNVGTASFRVSVDGTPPLLTVFDFRVEATDATGATVDYQFTASDDFDPNPSVACTPAPGSRFPIGETTVACVASDVYGNVGAPQSFVLTVVPQLRLGLTLAPFGMVVPQTGAVTVQGTVTCGRPAEVDVSGELVQKRSDQTGVSFFGVHVSCVPPVTTWMAAAQAIDGTVRPGRVYVRANAVNCDFTCQVAPAEREVVLTGRP